MTCVAVVDYGMGNLRSVAKALARVAPMAHVQVTADADAVRAADRVVFPGQGAMPDCMTQLAARGLRDAVVEAARTKPFLGICVGLQMLFAHSEEGDVAGLGLLPGTVRRFGADLPARGLKVPHMGWNGVQQMRNHALWQGIPDDARFYFVHSFFALPAMPELVAGSTDYGGAFAAAVARENLFAVQFHPEKSAQDGLRLLANFMSWNP